MRIKDKLLIYSKHFKNSGRRPSGEFEERIVIRDRKRIPKPVPAKAGRQRPRNLKCEEYKGLSSSEFPLNGLKKHTWLGVPPYAG